VCIHAGTDGDDWGCAYCQAVLGPVEEGWRERVTSVELPIAELFGSHGMRVRVREVPPAITAISRYCPNCASCLATDITTDRFVPRSPVLASSAMSVGT
jgi:hypothetical protein